MGGNALKNVPTRRLGADDYHSLAVQVCEGLRSRFGCRAQAIPAYRAKVDFGDLDVVVEQEKVLAPGDGHALLRAFAQEIGGATSFKPNGNVLSYDHWFHSNAAFQVDLILAPAAEFDATLAYFSYNDLGNLIGRTAHKMGFSYGHRGLMYPVRDGDHLIDTLLVCSDTDRVLPFLGYDASKFWAGFDTLGEIFDYVTGSDYFNPEMFLLENRNHTSRTRDRKRKTYMEFLEHLRTREDWRGYVFPADKKAWLPQAFAEFPGFEERYLKALDKAATGRFVRAHFNGDALTEWTGLTGKELGGFMSQVREAVGGSEGLAQLLREEGVEALRARVLALLPASRSARAARMT